jgi:hypothetical protein
LQRGLSREELEEIAEILKGKRIAGEQGSRGAEERGSPGKDNLPSPSGRGDGGEGELPIPLFPYSLTPLLMVGFNRRFAPLAKQMKTFVDVRQEPLQSLSRQCRAYPLVALGPDLFRRRSHHREGCHFIDFLTFWSPRFSHQTNRPDAGPTGRITPS